MAHLLRTLAAAGIVAGVLSRAASTPQAAEAVDAVPEGRGVAIDLGSDTSALTHWTTEGGSMHVVTTLDQ